VEDTVVVVTVVVVVPLATAVGVAPTVTQAANLLGGKQYHLCAALDV